MVGIFVWAVLIGFFQSGTVTSEARLNEGHYRLTVTIEDTTRGWGVSDLDVTMKLKRGFLLFGRKRAELPLKTNAQGKVVIEGLPKGEVELIVFLEKDRPQTFEPDLQPGLKNRLQVRSGKYSIAIEWKLL